MYIDAAGNVSLQPMPVVTCDTTTELADAATRWQSIAGNQPLSLESGGP
jgi:hypothetical protein